MKILCIGNNTEDTDLRTRNLAKKNNMECNGLLSLLDGKMMPIDKDGFYHTSIYDIPESDLIDLSKNFDSILILDQRCEDYSHPNAFFKTIMLAQRLSSKVPVEYIDSVSIKHIDFFQEFIKKNKSFCIFPFIELLTFDKHTTVCCRSTTPIVELKKLDNYQTDVHYQEIRKKMIDGVMIPEHCSYCYDLEEKGISSSRIEETVEWTNRLGITNLSQLQELKTPAYYEIRPSNICNLQCRMCSPASSHLIEAEYKKLKLIDNVKKFHYSGFDIVDFSNLHKLYISGGEPTAMPEFYQFLDRCIDQKKTDFELMINTNATKFSDKFKKQISKFDNFQFTVSIDGYDKLNHYIRWPSDWNSIIENLRYICDHKHKVFINVTISIYNVSKLYELFGFFDKEFPIIEHIHAQLETNGKGKLSPLNFPKPDVVIENIELIKNLKCYRNNVGLSSVLDGIQTHYREKFQFDLKSWKDFFDFNDILDNNRNIFLVDYLPEIEELRYLSESKKT